MRWSDEGILPPLFLSFSKASSAYSTQKQIVCCLHPRNFEPPVGGN